MKRYGQVIKVKKDEIESYKKLHSNVWPEILQLISDCNIRNYSIYLKDEYLFAYFEYVGDDFEADMKKKWLKMKPIKNGGQNVTHVRNRWRRDHRVNGGQIWKKFSTWSKKYVTATWVERQRFFKTF